MNDKYADLAARLGVKIDYKTETESTNIDARSYDYNHGDAVVAESQTKGRGQRGNVWSSQAGQNLTFSMVLKPEFLPASKQFLLSEIVSLTIVDVLASYGVESQVKWPNDIYITGLKVAGILIENDVMGSNLSRSIVGVGLNVNQTQFSAEIPNPTSMWLKTNRKYDLSELFARYYKVFAKRYMSLELGEVEQIENDYHSKLYLLNTPHTFKLPGGTQLTATIRRVEPSGELILEHSDSTLHSYLFKEVAF